MILIADSGSTKTDWRFIDDEQRIHQYSSAGVNPYFQSEQEIAEVFLGQPELSSLQPSRIFFYGAGCRTEDRKLVVRKALAKVFSTSEITIESDMLGAARSLFGNEQGIAVILGTGANTCFYDGKNITVNRTSSGFILGDEGSGAYLGKMLVKAYLDDELPADLAARFVERFNTGKDEIIDSVYRKPLPNRYLAGFSKFIFQNLKETVLTELVVKSFRELMDKQICRYEDFQKYPVRFTGSVAFYYSNLLRAVAQEKGVNVDRIVETPIAGLTLFHLGE